MDKTSMKTVPLLLFLLTGLGVQSRAAERVFTPDSFWYRPVPRNVPLHTNSANFVLALRTFRTAEALWEHLPDAPVNSLT